MPDLTPFNIHRCGTAPWRQEIRRATVEEARRAVRAALPNEREIDGWYFPFYVGQNREDVVRWLKARRDRAAELETDPGWWDDSDPETPDYGGAFDGHTVTSDADPGL